MKSLNINEKLDYLIDRWCARKELQPLRKILNGQAEINGLTDGWQGLLLELKTIKAQDKEVIIKDEYDVVVTLIHETEKLLSKY